jgi:hypothetical protein
MPKCMYYLKGDKCKCGCCDVPVRIECIECGLEPLVCSCHMLRGEAYYRVIRVKDGSVVNDM